jgi:hypothetical protein
MNKLQTTRPAVTVSADGELTRIFDATREMLPAVPLEDEVANAWRLLPELNGTVRVPQANGQPWTAHETANAAKALAAARTLRAAAAALEKAATEGYLTSLDIWAAQRAEADPDYAAALAKLPRNSKGHAVLGESGHPCQTPVPGTERQVLSAEYSFTSPQMTIQDLDTLRANHTLTRREYRRLTRTVRVIDTDAMKREQASSFSLAERLRGAWKRSLKSIQVHLREVETPVAA